MTLPRDARVVIIGGGAVGASALYHLALKGWTDVVLIEKDELTAGSTWHAAGNCPTFSASWAVMNMQRYSTELYRDLGTRVDYPMNYHVTGSLRLGHSMERMKEFEHVRGMGRYQGIDIELCTLSDLKNHYPFLETHDLEGGLYDPTDGDIDPAQLTQALAKGARDLGAHIERFCPATGATWSPSKKQWTIHTQKGNITCEFVVNAAGYRAQEVGRWFGRSVPMMTMSHQYLLTEPVPELENWIKEKGGKLPLLRDVDSSYYLRQEKSGFNLGPYENPCRGHWMTADDPMPDDFSFQLWEDDLERIEWYIEDAMARVPLLGSSGVSKVINGPIPYTPDGHPLIGPMPGVPNAFEAAVFTFGIAQSGGAGKVLAEWVTSGETEWDMWAVDPRRFGDWCDQDYCNQKGMEVYGHEYAMHFPTHEWPAGRNKRLSANDAAVRRVGGVMGVYGGWERANWFAKIEDDVTENAAKTWSRSGPWERRVREEVEAVRDYCGVLDLPGFSRFHVHGKGARAWLNSLITGYLPKPGRIGLVYFATSKGKILTEMSAIAHAEDDYTLITAAAAENHDFEVLWRANPPTGVSIGNLTSEYNTLIVAGPSSRSVLEAAGFIGNLDSPWLSHHEAKFSGQACRLVRVSFAGELGWEVHTQGEALSQAVYDRILKAGAKPFGMYALNSMRIEKGYRAWKGDLSIDYTLFEGGLGRFVKLNKISDFVGKAALANELQQGSAKGFVTLLVDGGNYDAPYMSTIWSGDEVVGEVTSSTFGYRTGKHIALGVVKKGFDFAGAKLSIEIFGQRHKAVVHNCQSVWDPENVRLTT